MCLLGKAYLSSMMWFAPDFLGKHRIPGLVLSGHLEVESCVFTTSSGLPSLWNKKGKWRKRLVQNRGTVELFFVMMVTQQALKSHPT